MSGELVRIVGVARDFVAPPLPVIDPRGVRAQHRLAQGHRARTTRGTGTTDAPFPLGVGEVHDRLGKVLLGESVRVVGHDAGATGRPDPIPFYGELGSVNPVVITAGAAASRGDELAKGLVGSFSLGAGQFCTKPGVVFVPEGAGFEERVAALVPAAATSRGSA